MAAFTTQIRRFQEVQEFLNGADEPGLPEFGWTVGTLATSVAVLVIDSPKRAQEQACRAAIRLLARAGKGDDITPRNAAWRVSRTEFGPFRPLRSGRATSSARLGALAACKLVDLVDTLRASPLTPTRRILADMEPSIVAILVLEAMFAVVGDFDDLSQKHRDHAEQLRRHQASMHAHAGRQEKLAPIKQRLVVEAISMRGKKARRQAARLTLQRFAKAEPTAASSLPKLRTLEGWLGQAGWLPRTSQIDKHEK
jgi:hypothetical protein